MKNVSKALKRRVYQFSYLLSWVHHTILQSQRSRSTNCHHITIWKKNCCFINERVGAILIPWVQFVISLSNYHTSNGVLLWKLFLHCAHCSTDIFQYFEWKKRNLEWDWRCHVCALLWRGGRSWVLGILWTKYVGVNTRFLLRFSS